MEPLHREYETSTPEYFAMASLESPAALMSEFDRRMKDCPSEVFT